MNERFEPGLGVAFLTPLYDTFTGLLGFKAFAKQVLRVLKTTGIRGDEAALDLGCGTGSLVNEIKSQFPRMAVTGMDPDRKMLQLAEKKIKKTGAEIELRHGFAQKLPFPDASFDIVTSTMVFHHLPGEVKVAAMKEVRRVLMPGGFFLLADFGKPESAVGKVLMGILGLFESLSDNMKGKLPVMLREAGFHVEEKRPLWRGVQFLVARPGR